MSMTWDLTSAETRTLGYVGFNLFWLLHNLTNESVGVRVESMYPERIARTLPFESLGLHWGIDSPYISLQRSKSPIATLTPSPSYLQRILPQVPAQKTQLR